MPDPEGPSAAEQLQALSIPEAGQEREQPSERRLGEQVAELTDLTNTGMYELIRARSERGMYPNITSFRTQRFYADAMEIDAVRLGNMAERETDPELRAMLGEEKRRLLDRRRGLLKDLYGDIQVTPEQIAAATPAENQQPNRQPPQDQVTEPLDPDLVGKGGNGYM